MIMWVVNFCAIMIYGPRLCMWMRMGHGQLLIVCMKTVKLYLA
mgnify:CR=1 FL=1